MLRLLATTLLCLGGLAAAPPTPASAQQTLGAKYGTREPRTCADRTAPARGAITAAQALRYFICDAESEFGPKLYLVENVQLQVGRSRPFQMRTDAFTDVDPSQPVYPIRGGFVRYQCGEPNKIENNFGKNCSVYESPNASGICYKTTFEEWHCTMMDMSASSSGRHKVAPPR